jgi:hypothetical protein
MQNIELAFLSEPDQVLATLMESMTEGSVVGISAPILGNGVFLTAVDNIIKTENDTTIVLKGYDITGYILERNKIRLGEIRAVFPFKSKFKNPYLKELAGDHFFE